jgi:hypothetical protein
LEEFFRLYGESCEEGEEAAEFYGDSAMAVTPAFVGCLKGREEIREAVKGVGAFVETTGMAPLEPMSISVHKIDPLHQWAKVRWQTTFAKTGDKLIQFDISYLVREDLEGYRILLYVSNQDEEKMRSEIGA